MFKNQIEAYFNKQGISVKNLDVRQTQSTKYHAFLTLVFKSAQECYDYFGSIRNSVNKYLVINNEWKIYEFVHKEQRKLDLGFIKPEPNERDEVVGNVFDEEESSVESQEESSVDSHDDSSVESQDESLDNSQEESSVDSISNEKEEDDDLSEYEKIYKWLVTPEEEEHQRQIEEIRSLCKWLATPYWERT
jgi:hypothetical protein